MDKIFSYSHTGLVSALHKIFACAMFAAAVFGMWSIVDAAEPVQNIGFQGQLSNNGSAVSGTVSATFKFYDALSGGSQQGSTISKSVQVSNGYFATSFDSSDMTGIDLNQSLWIEVSVNGNVLTPRSAVNSVPFANKAFGAFSFGSAPAAGPAGSLYYDSGTGYLMVSNGSSWTSVGSSGVQTFVVRNGFLATATSTDGVNAAYFVATSTSATSTFAGAVGIGTVSPASVLDIVKDGSDADITLTEYKSTAIGNKFIFQKAKGTVAAPQAIGNGNGIGTVQFNGYGDSKFVNGALIAATTESVFTDSSAPAKLDFRTTAVGEISPTVRLTIMSNGNIGIGTTTPFATLTVVGTASSTGTSSPAVHIVGGNASSTGEGGGFAFYGGQGGPSSGKGGSFFVLGGTGGTNGIGGSIDLKGGVGGSANFLGGAATLMGGDGSSAGSTGGGAFVFGGNAKGTNANAGGVVLVQGGTGAGSSGAGGIGGSVSLAGGTGGTGVSAGTGGNVYIYGGSPSSGTSLYGNVILGLASSSIAQGNIGIGSSTPNGAYVSIKNRSASLDVFDIASTSNASFFRVTSGGNVGIGTSSITSTLFVQGSSGTNPFAVASSTGTQMLTLLQNGYFGVGTSTPNAKLSVANVGSSMGLYVDNATQNIDTYGGYFKSNLINSGGGGYAYGVYAESTAAFDANGAYGIYGKATGNYSIAGVYGTSDAAGAALQGFVNSATGYGLHVQQSNASGFAVYALGGKNYFEKNVGLGTTTPSAQLAIAGISGNTQDLFAIASSSNARWLVVKNTGNVGIGTTTPGEKLVVAGNAQFTAVTSGTYGSDLNLTAAGVLTTAASDARLKENLEVLNSTSTLEKILQLKPYGFTWIGDPAHRKDVGLIAQDVEAIFPEIVFTNPVDGYKGVNYSRLPAIIVAGMQEVARRVEGFAEKISTKFVEAKDGLFGKVKTSELCVGETCITETELKQFLESRNPQSVPTMSPIPATSPTPDPLSPVPANPDPGVVTDPVSTGSEGAQVSSDTAGSTSGGAVTPDQGTGDTSAPPALPQENPSPVTPPAVSPSSDSSSPSAL